MKGSVSIHVPIPSKVDIKDGNELKWLMNNNGLYLKHDKTWPWSAIDSSENVLKLDSSSKGINTYSVMMLKQVAVLKEGTGVGEQALDSNKPRQATIIAEELTHFAVFDKHGYNRTIKLFNMWKQNELYGFLRSISFF